MSISTIKPHNFHGKVQQSHNKISEFKKKRTSRQVAYNRRHIVLVVPPATNGDLEVANALARFLICKRKRDEPDGNELKIVYEKEEKKKQV